MKTLDLTILILFSIFILLWIFIWIKTKNFLGIFGVINNSNQSTNNITTTTPEPTTTTPKPTTTTPAPTTTKPPTCISCIHGTCVNGVCICEPGYTGFNCLNEIKCPNNCSGNGICKLGKCECNTNWTGDDCTIYNANWYNKLYTTNSTCKTNELACKPGQCCINNTCINCTPDTIIQNKGQYDGQKPTCKVVSDNFCDLGDYCTSNGNCIRSIVYASYTNGIIKSKDGNVWEIANIKLPTNIIANSGPNNLYYNNNKFISSYFMIFDKTYNIQNSILYSNDGINWNLSLGENILDPRKTIYHKNKNIWIIVGGWPSSAVKNTIIYSNDAVTWKSSTNLMNGVNDVDYNNEIFVAVGRQNNDLKNTIIWSSDGITWTGLGTSIFATSGYAVKWNEKQKLWAAFGSDSNENTISAWSVDGKNWTVVNSDPFENYISDKFNEEFPIICDSRGYTETAATAAEKPPNILTIAQQSTNKYTQRYNSSSAECPPGDSFKCFCLDKTPLDAESQLLSGRIIISRGLYNKKVACNQSVNCRVPITGGISKKSKVNSINCNDSIWIATGEGKNTIVYSLDGKTWLKSDSGNIFNEVDNPYSYTSYTPSNGFGNSITFNKDTNTWIATGKGYDSIGRTIATSTDGINWKSVANSSNYPDVKSVQWMYLTVV